MKDVPILCLPLSPLSPKPGLVSRQEEWTLSRHRHMHEVNSFRCHRQPMYGRDLVHTIRSLCQQDPRKLPLTVAPAPLSPSSPSPAASWLWAGSLACHLLQTGVRPEHGGPGSLALSHCLCSYEQRAATMEGTIRRYINRPPYVYTMYIL